MLVLVFEFILSMVVLMGGGLMVYLMPDSEFVQTMVNASIPMILTYWFVRRTAEKKNDQKSSSDVK